MVAGDCFAFTWLASAPLGGVPGQGEAAATDYRPRDVLSTLWVAVQDSSFPGRGSLSCLLGCRGFSCGETLLIHLSVDCFEGAVDFLVGGEQAVVDPGVV